MPEVARVKYKSEFDFLLSTKSCFGSYEEYSNSWHCKGCVLKSKCKAKNTKDNEEGVGYET